MPPEWPSRSALEVEHRSWKREARTSVLSDNRITEFFLRQAAELARLQQLVVCRLLLDGRPIAALLGCIAGQTFYAHKTGYDETYQHLSPGCLLMAMWIERCHTAPPLPVRRFHMMGILDEAIARWTTATYPVGRLQVATRHPGKLLLKGFDLLGPLARRVAFAP